MMIVRKEDVLFTIGGGAIEDEVIECPRCGMMFQHSLAHRLEKAYLIESLHDDYTSLTEKQGQLERKINKLK